MVKAGHHVGLVEDHIDGSRTIGELTNGVAYYRNLGVKHDVINRNDFEFAFIENEIMSK